MSSGQLIISSFWAKVIAGVTVAVLGAGASAALATYSTVVEIKTELGGIERRVTTLEQSQVVGVRDDAAQLQRIEGRLGAIEATLKMLVDQ